MEAKNLDRILESAGRPLIGVDEAGRGCLAGPVFAGAVILSNEKAFRYRDSKQLTPEKRKSLFHKMNRENQVKVALATAQEIDQINILQASLLAMKRAVLALGVMKGSLLIDGKHIIKGLKNFTQIPIIKGDFLVNCISAASIAAKHSRDQWMLKAAVKFPRYGFEKHKGYPVFSHREAVKKWGPCSIHRKTFSGVK